MTRNDALTVLLVDDDDTSAIPEMLERSGFTSLRVHSIAEAESRAQSVQPSAVLISLSLSEQPGLAAVALMRTLLPRTPMVALADRGDESLALRALHQGCDEYLIRSELYATVLTRALKHAVEQRNAADLKRQMEIALQWERDFNSALVETAGCLFIVLDPLGRIVRFNNTCEQVSGYTREEVRGRYPWDFLLSADETPNAVATFRDAAKGVFPATYESHWVDKQKQLHLIRWSSTALRDEAGDIEFIVATGLEITHLRVTENALRLSEARYRKLFEESRDGIFLTDGSGVVTEANRALLDLLGSAPHEVVGRAIQSFVVDAPDRLMLVEEQQANRRVIDHELRVRRGDGRLLWCLLSMTERSSSEGGWQGILRDISDRRRAEERLIYNAHHDVLTSLPNRALFVDRLDRAVIRWRRHRDQLFAVLFIDLDRFKMVNDSLGHSAGDELLRLVGQIMRECVRDQDTVARLGGDEFALLLEDITSLADAVLVAERIVTSLRTPLQLGMQEVFTSCSIGIALPDPDMERADDLLRSADLAMYRAKVDGSGRYSVYDATMHSHAVDTMQMNTELHQALLNDEFVLHYQPIYHSADSTVCGFEALLRWNHPRRGLLMPQDFLELAEETGLIVGIGKWVLAQVCAQLAQWQQHAAGQRLPFVSLNISGKQLAQPGFVAEASTLLRKYHIDPRTLMIELTETSLLQNPESCAVTIAKLRSLGIRVCIDDFGTGYSSLSYLHRLPISGLKIDRSFVSALDQKDGPAIVSTIVTLAHNMGMYAVAEGVETARQLAALKMIGPKYLQGYFLSRPVQSSVAAQMLISAA